MADTAVLESFEHVRLDEIDPTFHPVPEGRYDLQVLKAELRTSKSSGRPYVKFFVSVVNHPEHSGRRIFPGPIMADNNGLKKLRKLMDATGVPQLSTIPDWLNDLSRLSPRFNAPVVIRDGRDAQGEPSRDNDINWFGVEVAANG